MPLRILEYSIEIIRSSINGKKINKILELPLIIPVVIYTGNEKWDANEYIEKSQAKLDKYKIRIGQYNLIDINNYTKKELLEDETFITKMMAVEKCRNTKEIVDVLETITKIVKEEDKEKFNEILELFHKMEDYYYVFSYSLGVKYGEELKKLWFYWFYVKNNI